MSTTNLQSKLENPPANNQQYLNPNVTIISKTTTVVPNTVDTSVNANPKSRKDWKSGTNALQELFAAKDEEIEYWRSQCEQLEYTITE